ncbi:uncharacterized protein LOC108951865 [Musa acuminata AAA Group]|uniref:uncharacterized protein LOC108951865 n=1 Tax=Musa acuminata AAA Group TaxID=214697 RepID=UPI0031DC5C2A
MALNNESTQASKSKTINLYSLTYILSVLFLLLRSGGSRQGIASEPEISVESQEKLPLQIGGKATWIWISADHASPGGSVLLLETTREAGISPPDRHQMVQAFHQLARMARAWRLFIVPQLKVGGAS